MSDDERLADFLMSKQWQDAQAKALLQLASSCQAVRPATRWEQLRKRVRAWLRRRLP